MAFSASFSCITFLLPQLSSSFDRKSFSIHFHIRRFILRSHLALLFFSIKCFLFHNSSFNFCNIFFTISMLFRISVSFSIIFFHFLSFSYISYHFLEKFLYFLNLDASTAKIVTNVLFFYIFNYEKFASCLYKVKSDIVKN